MKNGHYHNNYSRIKVKRKNNSVSLLHTSKSILLPVLLTLVLVAVLALAFALILLWVFKLNGNVSEQDFPPLLTLIIGVLESVVGLVSVWFVIRQLKSETETEEKENAVKVAEFIFKYNQEFIDSPKHDQIESYFDYTMNTHNPHSIKSLEQTPEIRQQLIDYLVYLEGFASCILNQIMEFSSVDNIFAFRFFIAVNHPEVQYISLFKYYSFYRGIFALYREWVQYRILQSETWNKLCNSSEISVSEICVTVWESRKEAIPYHNTALDLQDHYENSYEQIVRTIYSEEQISNDSIEAFSYQSKAKLGILKVSENDKNVINIAINRRMCSSQYEYFETLVFLLKKYVKKYVNPEFDQIANICLSDALLCHMEKGMEILVDNKGKEKIEKVIVDIIRAISSKNDLGYSITYKQLLVSDTLTVAQKKEMAALIYDTDPFIYPAMFKTKEDAVSILSELIDCDPLYQKERFWIAQSGKSVVGILLWVKDSVKWSPELLKKVADEKGIVLPDTLPKAVDEYFSERYDNPDNRDVISILNLCVNHNYRGMKIGDQLLSSFCSDHSSQKIKLCVLHDNTAAVQLYTKNGFRAEAIYEGFSVKEPRPKCIEMYRYN